MKAPLLVIYYVGRDNGFRTNICIDMSTTCFSVFYIENHVFYNKNLAIPYVASVLLRISSKRVFVFIAVS